MDDNRIGSPPIYAEEESFIMQLGRYWVHGILYSILGGIALIPTFVVLLFFTLFIGIIGLILGLVVVFLAFGWVNKMIAGFIWKMECRGSWQSLTGHGLGLFFVILVLGIPVLFVEVFFLYNPLLYYIISYGPVTILYGAAAKYVASYFKETEGSVITMPGSRGVSKAPMTTCPYCNAVFPYREIDLSLEGTAPCRTCGAIIQDPRYAPGGSRRPGYPRGPDMDPKPSRDQDDTFWG